MTRGRILKVVLVLIGLLFLAGAYPLFQRNTPVFAQMMVSLYVTLGVFLLLAVRNPSAHRSLIAYTAWSNLAHGATMAMQAFRGAIPRADLWRAVLPLVLLGILLLVLEPAKQTGEQASAATA